MWTTYDPISFIQGEWEAWDLLKIKSSEIATLKEIPKGLRMLLSSWSISAFSFYIIYDLQVADLQSQGKQRISYLMFQEWEWRLGIEEKLKLLNHPIFWNTCSSFYYCNMLWIHTLWYNDVPPYVFEKTCKIKRCIRMPNFHLLNYLSTKKCKVK